MHRGTGQSSNNQLPFLAWWGQGHTQMIYHEDVFPNLLQQQWTPGFCLGVKVKSWAGILVDGQVFRIINFLTGILPFTMFFTHLRPFLWQNTTHHKSLPLRLQPTMTGWLASLEWKTQSLAMLCSLGLQHGGGRQGTLSLGFRDDGDDGKHEKKLRMIMWCHKWSQKEHLGKIIPLFIRF